MPKTQMPALRNPPASLFEPTDPTQLRVVSIPRNKLVPFSRHPFKLYTGQKMDDLVESIMVNGVLLPLIVRPIEIDGEAKYEILSGHNRDAAGGLAGLAELPCIIKEGLSDEEALLIVTETNLLQRSFADMVHSERAAALSIHHSAIKHQGRRVDLLREIEIMLNTSTGADFETSAPVGRKLEARDKVAAEYALSKNTVARYLRVDKLIQRLKDCLDDGIISMRAAVSLSYLPDDAQSHTVTAITEGQHTVNIKKAEELKQAAERMRLSPEDVERILAGKTKQPRTSAFRLKPKLVKKYFPTDSRPDEIESTIIAALDYWFKAKIQDSDINDTKTC